MWLPHKKNSINPTPTSPRRSNFNRHSFKNIGDLLGDDDKTASTTIATADQPKPTSKKKPLPLVSSPPAPVRQGQSAFHRACLASHATRTIASTRSKPKHTKPNTAHGSVAHDKPNIAHDSDAHAKPNHAHDSIAHARSNHAHDSIAHSVRFHEKTNKAQDSDARAKHNHAQDSIAHARSNHAHDSVALAVRFHEKTNKAHGSAGHARRNHAHDSVVPAVSIHKNPNKAHGSSVHEKPNQAQDSIASLFNIPNSEKRVVVYMTSLGAVRQTYDACRAVRSILQGFRVPVDERDLSMDSSYKDELHKIMLQTQIKKQVGLPRVFIGGRYVGDADDVRQLSETGELKKLLEGLPAVSRGVCSSCGDFRFVICSDCNGSRKCYTEKGFRSCMVCNKNGLIRCPHC